MRIERLKNFTADYSPEKLRDILMSIEEIRQEIKDAIVSNKFNNEERMNRVMKGLFHMMAYVLELPFNRAKFQIKGYEMVGNILSHFKNYKLAIIYYMQGVLLLIHIEILC